MVKIEQITKVSTVKHRYCDFCETKLNSNAVCVCCKKDLCHNCIGHDENDGGDYYYFYCQSCWNKGEPYREKIKQLEKEIDILSDEWLKECNS